MTYLNRLEEWIEKALKHNWSSESLHGGIHGSGKTRAFSIGPEKKEKLVVYKEGKKGERTYYRYRHPGGQHSKLMAGESSSAVPIRVAHLRASTPKGGGRQTLVSWRQGGKKIKTSYGETSVKHHRSENVGKKSKRSVIRRRLFGK